MDTQKKTQQQIPEVVEAQEIREFTFDDDRLELAIVDGTLYIAIKPICTYLEIDWSAQLQRIKDDEVLNAERRLVAFSPKNDDQRREMVALPIDKMHGWLFGITVKRLKNPRPDLTEKIQRYRRNCFNVLWQEFSGKGHQQESPSTALTLLPQQTQQVLPVTENVHVVSLTEQVTMLSNTVPSIAKGVTALLQATETQNIHLTHLLEMSIAHDAKLESLLEAVSSQTLDLAQAVALLSGYLQSQDHLEEKIEQIDERTKRLSPAHALQIQEAVGHVVTAVRRKNPSITEQIAYRMIYGRLKSRFRPATSYREIDDTRFEEAMDFLRQERRSILENDAQQPRLF